MPAANGGSGVTSEGGHLDATHVHVRQLVQAENAKTILLNVPLEVATAEGEVASFKAAKRGSGAPSPKAETLLVQPAPIVQRKSAVVAASSSRRRRVRSASVGRDKRSDLQARYWACLIENLRRAVDDLYNTCEVDDNNVSAAKEVILVLENYVRDFKNLVSHKAHCHY